MDGSIDLGRLLTHERSPSIHGPLPLSAIDIGAGQLTSTIPRLVLHVGIHKTATTTLQVALRDLRTQLRDRGVGLVTIEQMKKLAHESAWAARLTADPAVAPQFQEELRRLVGREIERVERRSGRPVEQVVISNERMVGARMPSEVDYPVFRPLAEASITEVIDALQPDEVHVALYTRRQDRLIESCYLWEIQKGLTHTVGEQFPFMGEPIISFADLADRISRMPSVSSLRVRPFEIISAGALPYVDDFLANVGLSGSLDYSVVEEDLSANQSYSHAALQIALEINRMMDTREQRRELRRFLKTRFPVGAYPPAAIMLDEDRNTLLDLYSEDNERLFDTWMPELPRDAYSSPARTKALGSVLAPISTGR
jgi:hypothetical protein